jgi:hypothetical protein
MSVGVSAQWQYGVHVAAGYSNFIEKNKESSVQPANAYFKRPAYALGAEVAYTIFTTKFQAASGLDFESFAAENRIPDNYPLPANYTGQTRWDERFYALSVPVKVNYKFEEWLRLNVGVVNTFLVKTPDEAWNKGINRYVLGFTGGLDFIIKKHFTVGASYYKDLKPLMKWSDFDVFYYRQEICVKVGYLFH